MACLQRLLQARLCVFWKDSCNFYHSQLSMAFSILAIKLRLRANEFRNSRVVHGVTPLARIGGAFSARKGETHVRTSRY